MPDLERRSLKVTPPPALVLVDLITGFTDPHSPLGSESDAVVAANRKLLDLFRQRQWPIFFTTITYHSPEQARVFRAHLPALEILKPGAPAVEVDPRLGRQDNEPLVERLFPSAFFRTGLARWLEEAQVKSLVVTGLTTSGCVRATAVDGLQHDYPVFLPRECTGDRNPDAHEANLFDLHAKYADVLPLETLLSHCRAL